SRPPLTGKATNRFGLGMATSRLWLSWFKVEPMEMIGVGLLTFIKHLHQVTVNLRANPADQVLNPIEAVREKVDVLQDVQALYDGLESGVQVGDGAIQVGPHRLQFCWFVVKVGAQRLRQVDRAFSFTYSHGLPASEQVDCG